MKNFSLVMAAFMAATPALAEPTLYPPGAIVKSLSTMNNTTDSNIIADTQDQKKVWVMPPNTGQASVSNLYLVNANVGFCPEISELQHASIAIVDQLTGLNNDLADQKKRIGTMLDELDQARKAAADYAADKNMKDLSDADERIDDMESRLSVLYEQDNKCKTDCDKIEQEISDTEKAKREALSLRSKIAAQHAQDMAEYNKRKAKVDAIQQNLDDANLDAVKLDERVAGAQKLILDNYGTFGQMEGGRAAIIYSSGWDANVDKLRQENPGVMFNKIETRNAKIMSSIQVKGLAGSAIIAVESSSGANGNTLNNAGLIEYPSYPGNFSTDVVLSLLGACPVLHPADYGLNPDLTKTGGIKFGLSTSYEYPTVVTYSVNVTYNLHSFYQKIVDSGSSGGFFSSHSYTNITETSAFKDAISITWNDPENMVPADQKKEIEKDLRMDVLARLVATVMPGASSVQLDQYATLAKPPEHGAAVISSSLMTACPGNAYCLAGALVLSALDSIFGSSSSTASYAKIEDRSYTDQISTTSKYYKPWVTTYQPQ